MALKNALGDIALDASLQKIAEALDILAPLVMATDPATGRVRMIPEGGTVSTVSNCNAVGGILAQSVVLDMMQTNWSNAIRGRIS